MVSVLFCGVSRTMSELKSLVIYPLDCVNSTIFSGFLSILITACRLAESRDKKQNPTKLGGVCCTKFIFLAFYNDHTIFFRLFQDGDFVFQCYSLLYIDLSYDELQFRAELNDRGLLSYSNLYISNVKFG